MNNNIPDKLYKFIKKMQETTSYIKIHQLKDGYTYKIYARHAYAGIWMKNKNGFLIARYKYGPEPYLFMEYHWDFYQRDLFDFLGTAKPIELIEKCPFKIKDDISDYSNDEEKAILKYLLEVEKNNPVVCGLDTAQQRKLEGIKFNEFLFSMKNRGKK